MGDLLNNSEMLKKLGFDNSNQWIIYDEQFEKFFNFLSDNITDANILSCHELLERNEMQERGQWLDDNERILKMKQIEADNAGLLIHKAHHVEALKAEIATIDQATFDYSALTADMHISRHALNNQLSDLEYATAEGQSARKQLLADCQAKAQQLEEVQRENCKLSEAANKALTGQQVPPLFMHQMPLDQYIQKCDSFMQYFQLYMKDNFKILDYTDIEGPEMETLHKNSKLENLQNSIQHYRLAYIKEKVKAKVTQAMMDSIDVNQIHCINLADMARETHEMQIHNENHLKNTQETLLNALAMHVQQQAQQRIELVLYENTKQKLERVLRRRESDKQLTAIISNGLSNAELVWIAIQLDLEKTRNSTDSTVRLCALAQSSCQRLQTMRSLNASTRGICGQFVDQLASQLSEHLGQTVRTTDAKSCLYDYEKFGRLLAYAQQNMLNKKSQVYVNNQQMQLIRLEQSLRPFVYDSPLEQPMFENVRYLYPMFNVVQQHNIIEESLRRLRQQFQESIMTGMDKEKLVRYSKVLWIWFLTEPQRMLHAIDEVKKCSANVPALSSNLFRPNSGLLRK